MECLIFTQIIHCLPVQTNAVYDSLTIYKRINGNIRTRRDDCTKSVRCKPIRRTTTYRRSRRCRRRSRGEKKTTRATTVVLGVPRGLAVEDIVWFGRARRIAPRSRSGVLNASVRDLFGATIRIFPFVIYRDSRRFTLYSNHFDDECFVRTRNGYYCFIWKHFEKRWLPCSRQKSWETVWKTLHWHSMAVLRFFKEKKRRSAFTSWNYIVTALLLSHVSTTLKIGAGQWTLTYRYVGVEFV